MAWRDDFVLHLIHRYDPNYIEMPPQTMIELSNDYLDENNPFAAFAQLFVKPFDQPDAHFTIKQAKLLWPLFQDFLKSHGRCRIPMPAEAKFLNALFMTLGAPCHIQARIPGSSHKQRSVFFAFKLPKNLSRKMKAIWSLFLFRPMSLLMRLGSHSRLLSICYSRIKLSRWQQQTQ